MSRKSRFSNVNSPKCPSLNRKRPDHGQLLGRSHFTKCGIQSRVAELTLADLPIMAIGVHRFASFPLAGMSLPRFIHLQNYTTRGEALPNRKLDHSFAQLAALVG